MKEFTSGDIRNFAVVGHGAAGKTVLCEAMLSCAGEISRMGSIEAKILYQIIIMMNMNDKYQFIHHRYI